MDDYLPSPRVTLDINIPHAVIRFNRPAQRNKLSTATLDELDAILTSCENGAGLRALIFTGAENVFASGADITELRALTPDAARKFAERGQKLFRRIADSSILTIAAINGYCMGGGLDLALACRLRFAAREAIFAHPGATLGIITGWGGTQRLPALIGRTRALEMFLTARRMTSTEAFDCGLVHRICDAPLTEAVDEVVRRLRKIP